MLLFVFIYPGQQVTDDKLDSLRETQEAVRKAITGKDKSTNMPISKSLNSTINKSSLAQYNSAKICITEGGNPPSNNTTAADMRQTHAEIEQHKPALLNCSRLGGGDIFESRHDRRLKEPGSPS